MIFAREHAPELKVPIVSAERNDSVYNDPERSVVEALESMPYELSPRIKKDILIKARDRYHITPPKLAANAVDLICSAYDTGKLDLLGLPKEKELENFDLNEAIRLAEFSDDVLESSVISHFDYASFGPNNVAKIAEARLRSIVDAQHLVEGTVKIFDVERVPDMKTIFREGHIPSRLIPALRKNTTVQKFQSWLADQHAAGDAQEILREYLAAVQVPKGLWQATPLKFGRSLLLTALLGAVGSVLADGAGLVGGGALGAVSKPLIDGALSYLDSEYVEQLLKGWTPKLFVEKIRKESERPYPDKMLPIHG